VARRSLIPPLIFAALLAGSVPADAQTPEPAAPDAAEPPANVNASEVVSLRSARNVSARQPARIPANRSQADGSPYFDDRVSVERVTCRDAGGCDTDDAEVDYEVRRLKVRAEPRQPALIEVDRARTRNPGNERRVRLRIALRPPGGPRTEGDLTLRPGRDLLDPSNFEGTGLEDSFRQVRNALSEVTGEGQPLEKLTIVFRRGEVDGPVAHVLSMSAGGTLQFITLRLSQRSDAPQALPVVPQSRPSPPSQRSRTRSFTERAPPEKKRSDRVSQLTNAQLALPNPGDVADTTGDVLGAVLAGVCESVGGTDCRPEQPAPPELFVRFLTTTLFADSRGAGELAIGCPSGYEGVTGVVEIQSEVRIRKRQQRLAELIIFKCDQPQKYLAFHLLELGRDKLRDERALVVVVTVRITTPDGRRAGDVDNAVALRRTPDRGAPG
jgi:hypothetical protein